MENVEQIVARAAGTAGESERHRAFAELVRQFQDIAWGWAYARLGNFALAEDAAQEAFIAAYTELPRLREPGAFPGWFRRIVSRQCSRIVRSRGLKLAPLEPGLEPPDAQPDPSQMSETREVEEQVRAAIGRLPEKERQVTTLFYISGHSMKEIASFVGITESTVTNRLRSARGKLKERLIDMVRDYLDAEKPSRDGRFASAVRRAVEEDWEPILEIAHAMSPFDREGNEHWMRVRQAFDTENRIRRHYAVHDPDTGQVIGYGSIEQQDPDPQRFRLYVVVSPEMLRQGVGDIVYERLMEDLKELNATSIWVREAVQQWPADYPEKYQLDFLQKRGFAQTRLVWDLFQPLKAVDRARVEEAKARVAARGIAISTLSEELQQNPDALSRQVDLFNAWHPSAPHSPSEPPPKPVELATVAEYVEKDILLHEGCFIAKDGEEFVGSTWLRYRDPERGKPWHKHRAPEQNRLDSAMTGILAEYRGGGIATALRLCAAEWARDQGYEAICEYVDDCNKERLELDERVGFQRHIGMVVLEKKLGG